MAAAPAALVALKPENFQDFGSGQRLGQGANGGVRRAHLILTGPPVSVVTVAIKTLTGPSAEASESEVKTAMALVGSSHANVIQYMGYVVHHGVFSLVMEHVDRDSLDLYCARKQRRDLDVAVLRGVARQALLGLQHMHSMRLLHRDLKPSNMLLNSNGDLKLTDMDASRVLMPGKSVPSAVLRCFSSTLHLITVPIAFGTGRGLRRSAERSCIWRRSYSKASHTVG